MKDKVAIEEKSKKLAEMTARFCDEKLDDDYKQLCQKLIIKMKRKRNVPFLSGKLEIWAAAIIYALGRLNFLFDKSFEPYVSGDDICDYFGTSRSTTSQKARLILDTFKMTYYDDEFSTTRMRERNPFSKFAMMSGFIVPIDAFMDEDDEQIEEGRKKR
ncbi:MAG: hypothetical protein KKI06_09675 [Euryarchaeota archaeon]|nr:hypothetical protein [Euryarchaeota archaeon]